MKKNYYNVSFKLNGVYCANVAHAATEEDVRAAYAKYELIAISPATEGAVRAAERRGKPIVECDHIETAETAETADTADAADTADTADTADGDTKKATGGNVSISAGNAKMGAIPSVSLPAGVTCDPSAPCFRKCYARRMAARRATVRNAYARNYDILLNKPAAYWLQVRAAATMTRFFRFHVSGDIVNAEYFAEMVRTAQELPGTNFLAFTKKYGIVNDFIAAGGTIPGNLKVIFSEWGEGWTVPNPYHLPTSRVIFKGEEIPENVKICGGNCAECACRGVGCWELKNGETIAFFEH